MGLSESVLYYFGSKPVYFKIHLNSGDALMSAAYFKVHISEKVLKPLNVHHSHPAFALGDKTTGNARYGGFYGNTRVHKGQSGAAYRSLRGRTVGGQNLGNKPDSVGKFLNGWNNRLQRSLSKCAVSYFTPSRSSAGLSFAYGVGWEIVVVHIALFFFLVKTVQFLGIAYGT